VEHVWRLQGATSCQPKSSVSTENLEPIEEQAVRGGYPPRWLTLLRWWTVMGNSWNRTIRRHVRSSRRRRRPYEDW
jgi:hypothetical protein